MNKKQKLFNDLTTSTEFMHDGREKLFEPGDKGKLALAVGLDLAKSTFIQIKDSKDCEFIVQAEQLYLKQERELNKPNKLALSSINQSINDIDGAIYAVGTFKEPGGYIVANRTYLNRRDSRTRGVPKDGFHKACNSHVARLEHSLRNSSLLKEDGELLQQRLENIKAAKEIYIDMQKEALGLPKDAPIKGKDKDREI